MVRDMPKPKGRKSPLNQEPSHIVWARERTGLNRVQLAEASGINYSLLCDIEKGTRNATPANLRRIADALNAPITALERRRDYEQTA